MTTGRREIIKKGVARWRWRRSGTNQEADSDNCHWDIEIHLAYRPTSPFLVFRQTESALFSHCFIDMRALLDVAALQPVTLSAVASRKELPCRHGN